MEEATRFLSLDRAIDDVFLDLAVNPNRWYDLALFAKVYGFLTNGGARPGIMRPGEFLREERGIWFKARREDKEEFISKSSFEELAIDLIPEVITDNDGIAQAYEWAMWVNVSQGKGSMARMASGSKRRWRNSIARSVATAA